MAPTDLTATAIGQSAIELAWTAPAADPGRHPVTGYRIEWSMDGVTGWTRVEPPHSGTETTYRHAGLDPDTTRHYRVFALSEGGEGPASDPASTGTAPLEAPLPPTDLTATGAGPTVIELEWVAPPPDPARHEVTGYRIEWSVHGVSDWTRVEPAHAGTATMYRHSGLDPDTTRYYRAFARSASGESSASNLARAETGPPAAPLAPTGLTATALGPTVIELEWVAPPPDPARHEVTGYRIEWSVHGVSDWTPVEPAHAGTETMYRHSGLDPDTTRYYRAFARSASGESLASNLARAETGPPAVPLAPTDLTATAAGQTAIELAWTAPAADPGRHPVTGYRIEWSADGHGDWNEVEPAHAGTEVTYLHTGLRPEMIRHYQVFALSSDGEGPASEPIQAATEEAFVIVQQMDPALPAHLDFLDVAIYVSDTDEIFVEFRLRGDIPTPPIGELFSYRLHFDTDKPYWSHPVDFSDEDMFWYFDIWSNRRRAGDDSETFWIRWLPSDEDNVLRMRARLPAGAPRISAMVWATAVHFDSNGFVQQDFSRTKLLEIGN